MKSHKKLKDKKGFTLVELLVVIAIIVILAIVAVPALFKNINKAKMADLKSDYNTIKTASTMFYAEHSRMPLTYEEINSEMESVVKKSPFGTDYYYLVNKNECTKQEHDNECRKYGKHGEFGHDCMSKDELYIVFNVHESFPREYFEKDKDLKGILRGCSTANKEGFYGVTLSTKSKVDKKLN